MSISYFVTAVSPKGQEVCLHFGTTQGLNRFYIDNREWGFTILRVKKHIRFESGYEEVSFC